MTADVSEVRTDRLLLRRFRVDDWVHLRRMDTDPVVMATLGAEIEVEYGLLPHFWGRGLATELATAATAAGFEAVGLDRLIGITLPSNAASRRVLEKVGFRLTLESAYQGFDVVVYEQTAAEHASRAR